jgi:hypothetical protein
MRDELHRCQTGYARHAPPYGDPVMRAAFALNWFVVRGWLAARRKEGL